MSWFKPFSLKCDVLVSKCALLKCNLYRYTEGVSDDTAGRLAKARIRALQDELSAQGKELREAHSRWGCTSTS
jgi:hypothetical protein